MHHYTTGRAFLHAEFSHVTQGRSQLTEVWIPLNVFKLKNKKDYLNY